jgi:hypothetical protein
LSYWPLKTWRLLSRREKSIVVLIGEIGMILPTRVIIARVRVPLGIVYLVETS